MLPRLLRFCRSLCGTSDQAEDLLQATIERALAREAQWQAGTRLDSWMYRIAQTIHIDRMRAQKVRGVPMDIDDMHGIAGDDGRQQVEGRSELAAIGAAFDRLPEDQRTILTLIALDGMAYRDAAEILGIPVGTVMSRLSRARAALDRAINPVSQDVPK